MFTWLDPTSGTPVELERQLPRLRGSKNALTGGQKVEGEIAGKRSPVRIPAEPPPTFVVRVPERTGDPYALLQFFRLKESGNKRVIKLVSVSAWDGSVTAGYEKEALVPFQVTLYGANSYNLTPRQTLEPGEYCLGLVTSDPGFCFGVDTPARRQAILTSAHWSC